MEHGYDADAARREAKRRRKRKKRIRKMVLLAGILLLFVALVSVLVWGAIRLIGGANQPEPTPMPTPVPAVEPTPTPTVEPTSVPAATPTIDAPWYSERNAQMRTYMEKYGNYASDAALQTALDSRQIDPNGKMVALTFDDGPNGTYTAPVLDILERYNVRATFFIKGAAIAGHESLIERTLALGCEIGNHTMNHEDLEEISDADMKKTVRQVNDLMAEKFGYEITLLRPPYISFGEKGSDKREAFVTMLKEYGMACINHSRSSHDTYPEYTASMISERMLLEKDELGHGIDNGIFLFHDKSQKTVDALPAIIEGLLENGYQLVTVSELLNCSEEGFHVGWIYSRAD